MWYQGHCFTGFGQWFSSHWLGGFILNLLIVAVLAVLLYKLIRRLTAKPLENRDVRDSLVILETRLAEGKISEEEYQKIRNILRG